MTTDHINITLRFHKTMKYDNKKQDHILLNHKLTDQRNATKYLKC